MLGGRQDYVIPYDKWRPIAQRWDSIKSSTHFNLTIPSVVLNHSQYSPSVSLVNKEPFQVSSANIWNKTVIYLTITSVLSLSDFYQHLKTYLLCQSHYTVSQKNSQNYFCYNFVKFSPTLTIFGTKMAKRLKLYEVHSFSTSPNLCNHTTVLNADVPNCYITL